MIPITLELARRLEDAEARHLTRQVEICAQLQPKLHAHVVTVAGGIAAFSAGQYGRKLNHVTGCGLDIRLSEYELEALENAYAELNLATEIDLCPFVDREVLKLLARRSYTVNAFNNTYVKALDDVGSKVPTNPSTKVEIISPVDAEDFLATSISGFSMEQQHRATPLIQTLAKIATKRDDTRLYIARVNGEFAGTAGLGLIKLPDLTIAHLYIASTLPMYRERGVQQALIQARLADAQNGEAKLATITARPTNVSSRNALRAGFQLAYTRSTFSSRLTAA